MEEKQTETIPFYTTLSQLNSYPQKSAYLQNQKEKKLKILVVFLKRRIEAVKAGHA